MIVCFFIFAPPCGFASSLWKTLELSNFNWSTHFPNMLVRKILCTISARVQPRSDMNVPMLSQIVGCGVMLSACHANESLGSFDCSDAEALLLLLGGRLRVDVVLVHHVVGVVVGDVAVIRRKTVPTLGC